MNRLVLYMMGLILVSFLLFIKRNKIIYLVSIVFLGYLLLRLFQHDNFLYLEGLFLYVYSFFTIMFIVVCIVIYNNEKNTNVDASNFYLFLAITIIVINTGVFIRRYTRHRHYSNIAHSLLDSCDQTYHELYTECKGYRIGDILARPLVVNMNELVEYHTKTYPDSLASRYSQKTNERNKYNVLLDCIRETNNTSIVETNKILPLDHTYVIHIRVGDVIEFSDSSVHDILSKPCYYQQFGDKKISFTIYKNNYSKPLSYFDEKLEKIKSYPIKEVVLVAGSHFPIDFTKSSRYLNCIKLYIEQHGYHVTLRIGRVPDDDILFMSHAPYFTPSGGGFSAIITEVVKLNKGIVI